MRHEHVRAGQRGKPNWLRTETLGSTGAGFVRRTSKAFAFRPGSPSADARWNNDTELPTLRARRQPLETQSSHVGGQRPGGSPSRTVGAIYALRMRSHKAIASSATPAKLTSHGHDFDQTVVRVVRRLASLSNSLRSLCSTASGSTGMAKPPIG